MAMTYDEFYSIPQHAERVGAIGALRTEEPQYKNELVLIFAFATPTGEACRLMYHPKRFSFILGSARIWLDDIWVESNVPGFKGSCLCGSMNGDKIFWIGNRI